MQRRWILTENTLGPVPDREIVQTVIDAVLEYIGDLQPNEDDYQLVRQIPKAAQYFWAMRLFESEVNNGGFEQYFWNSSSTLMDVALEGYGVIGAKEYAHFLQTAATIMGTSSYLARRRQSGDEWTMYKNACPPTLDALNEEFYRAESGDSSSGGSDLDLDRKKVTFIRHNYKAICGQ